MKKMVDQESQVPLINVIFVIGGQVCLVLEISADVQNVPDLCANNVPIVMFAVIAMC